MRVGTRSWGQCDGERLDTWENTNFGDEWCLLHKNVTVLNATKL